MLGPRVAPKAGSREQDASTRDPGVGAISPPAVRDPALRRGPAGLPPSGSRRTGTADPARWLRAPAPGLGSGLAESGGGSSGSFLDLKPISQMSGGSLGPACSRRLAQGQVRTQPGVRRLRLWGAQCSHDAPANPQPPAEVGAPVALEQVRTCGPCPLSDPSGGLSLDDNPPPPPIAFLTGLWAVRGSRMFPGGRGRSAPGLDFWSLLASRDPVLPFTVSDLWPGRS